MSRGWFEDDEDFNLRVEASRAQAKSRAAVKKTVKKSVGGAGRGAGGGSKPILNWVVPGASKRKVSKPAAKKSATSKNTFAAMMMDSDSDSD